MIEPLRTIEYIMSVRYVVALQPACKSNVGKKKISCVFNVSPEPSSEYVISLKTFNNVGEGIPIYETTFTREETSTDFEKFVSLDCMMTTASLFSNVSSMSVTVA